MKFIHIADVHLGAVPEAATVWGKVREKEIYETFSKVIKICETEKTDLLLIAGDLFHRQPLLRELKEINYLFTQLTHTKVVIMAGNHDYINTRSNYLSFTFSPNVHFFLESAMDSIYFEDINTEVYGFSYTARDIHEEKYDNAFCTVEERINILLAHGGDANDIPINYKKLEQSGFDYIALGHIHKRESFSEKMVYAGSLEPLDKTETGEHGYIAGTIEKQGHMSRINTSFYPAAKRKYVQDEITVTKESTNLSLKEQVDACLKAAGKDDFHLVTLKGYSDAGLLLDLDCLRLDPHILEINSQVLPDYDFDKLYEENKNNIIGAYIQKIRESSVEESIRKKALCYGMEALLHARER